MTSAAQLEANRRNAQRSTGPRTGAGKSWSSQNALKHGFTGPLLVGLQYGPFADDPTELEEFIEAVLAELAPVTAQERALVGRNRQLTRAIGRPHPGTLHRHPPAAEGH